MPRLSYQDLEDFKNSLSPGLVYEPVHYRFLDDLIHDLEEAWDLLETQANRSYYA